MAWLGTWAKRISITADHTLVDSDLTDFPVLLKVSTSSGITSADISAIFDELTSDANRKKIAITKSDEITECYCEIDNWDDATETAYLWVKCPSMSSSVDQVFYIYYDSAQLDNTSYVGDTGDTPAENVWDSNFKMVHHMKDTTTSTITDSTSNSQDGTKKAANEPIEANGKIHKGQDFDGSNDYIQCGTGLALTTWTQSLIVYRQVDGGSNNERWLTNGDIDNFNYAIQLATSKVIQVNMKDTAGGNNYIRSVATIPLTAHNMCVGTFDGTHLKIFIQGALDKTSGDLSAKTPKTDVYQQQIGRLGFSSIWYYKANSIFSEVRISNIARSAAWNKADYNSCWDTLFTYGSEELRPSGTVMAGYYYRLLMQGA
jgi:hypothetical protein